MAQGDAVAAGTAPGRAPSRGRASRRRIAPWAPVLVLLALCAVIAAINPNFLTFNNFVRISQAAMIPLVLGLGATFIILMGSIDLSIEGILALCAVILSLLVLNGANGNDLGLLGVAVVLAVGAGAGNAILGGLAVRINDPLIRGLAIERFLGLPWGVWLALAALLVAWVIQDHTRLGRYLYALGGGEDLAALSGIPVARVRIAAFTIAGIFYALGG